MDKIRIIGVPEHFNYPWLKIIEEQPFKTYGTLLEWTDEPKGSGAMNKALREGKADVAVILTESFIKDRIEGNPGKIIGYHVQSPLIWGIHLSSQFADISLDELSDVPFAISRYGSGSHLMAFLLAQKMGWDTSRAVLTAWRDLVKAAGKDYLTEDKFLKIQDEVKNQTGAKGKNLFMPIRVAVIGKPHGTELKILVPLIKTSSLIARAEQALSKVK